MKEEFDFGRFTNMSREEVQAYLERWGFAVYDNESLDELRHAAHLNDQTEGGEDAPT